MFIIGELINGMYKQIGKAIVEKDKRVIQDIAKEQIDAGASALDVNCGPLSKDPVSDMQWLVETIQEVVDTILCLDSTKPEVIEAGLKLVKKKAIINSISADSEKLDILLPMAVKYKTYLIGLALDKKGVPQDKDRRIELAATIAASVQEANFPIQDLFLDPVVLPVNVAQAQGVNVIEAIREFKLLTSPAPKVIVGLSNISQGTCKRSLINRTFLVMAISSGLDAAILDPLDKELMDSLITAELILNKHIYCDSFLEAYRKS
jgi:5-methyltetrahydrofolate corrinoid/iron sulfur protein methyltransferase